MISPATVPSLDHLIIESSFHIFIDFFNRNYFPLLTGFLSAFTRRSGHNDIFWEFYIDREKDYSQQNTHWKHRESRYHEGIISGATNNGRLRLGQTNKWNSGFVNRKKVLFLGPRPPLPFLGSLVFRPKALSPNWGMSPVTSGAPWLFTLAAFHLRWEVLISTPNDSFGHRNQNAVKE